ncbi:MAG: hypothetical protein ACOC55_05505, partial [Candidatus Natronoplasma sp.]
WNREGSNSAGPSSQKRLDDLKRIQFNSGDVEFDESNSRRKRSKKKDKKNSSVLSLFSTEEDELPNRSVQHHSSSDGDDWEVL